MTKALPTVPLEPAVLESIVTSSIKLDSQIKADEKRLKELKGQLITEATLHKKEHTPTDGGGVSWTAKANDGSIARVTFPADSLKDKIDPTTQDGLKLVARFTKGASNAARKLKRYFTRQIILKPREDFRALVEQDFPPAIAEKLIAACEKDTDTKVSFETAKTPEAK